MKIVLERILLFFHPNENWTKERSKLFLTLWINWVSVKLPQSEFCVCTYADRVLTHDERERESCSMELKTHRNVRRKLINHKSAGNGIREFFPLSFLALRHPWNAHAARLTRLQFIEYKNQFAFAAAQTPSSAHIFIHLVIAFHSDARALEFFSPFTVVKPHFIVRLKFWIQITYANIFIFNLSNCLIQIMQHQSCTLMFSLWRAQGTLWRDMKSWMFIYNYSQQVLNC